VVANPYDVMSTAQSGLPDSGWIEDNIFTTAAGTQAAGSSSASLLINQVGLRLVGDVDFDGDVDNADIGRAVGSYNGSSGAGKVYSDGDMDFDGDVDNADIGRVAGAFTGALPTENLPDGGGNADLIYDPATGDVWLNASEAAGGVVTSFQLENADGTFTPGNYVGPTGGLGGCFKDVGADVIADSDLTFAGFSGIRDFGNIFPAGMDLAQLEAFLTTAVYTGAFGSGQQQIGLMLIPEPATLALLGLGGLGMVLGRKRR
jgi:hypothetical protein